MATSSMAFRGDRRGPVQQNRHGGRNNYNAQRQNMRRSNNMQHQHQQQPPQQPPSSQNAQALMSSFNHGDKNVYKNERCVRVIMNIVGHPVKLTTANGSEFEGVLSAVSPSMDVELKECRNVRTADGKPGSRTPYDSLLIRSGDIMLISAPNLELKTSGAKGDKGSEFLTDSAISRANGTNGKDGLKPLVEWRGDSEGSDGADLSLEPSSNDMGKSNFPPEVMFRINEENFDVKSTYQEDMNMYTTPIPKFASKAEQLEAENRAAQAAQEIESSEGYRNRIDVENNDNVDEETKYSAVVRNPPDTSSASRTYVAPGRRQQQQQQQHHQDGHALPQLNQRGVAPGLPPHQPLPQRERRADRDRGDRNHHDQRGGGDREKMSRTPPLRNLHALPPQAHGPTPGVQPLKEPDRLSGDRRPEGQGRGGYPPRPGHQDGPVPHHHGVHQPSPVPQPPVNVSQGASHQPAHGPPLPPNHHSTFNHVPSPVPGGPVNTSVAPPGPLAQLPPNTLPPLAQMQASRPNPPPPNSSASVLCASQNVTLSPAEGREAPSMPSSSQHQPPPVAATSISSLTGGDKKSPREKDRQEQQVARLKEFHDNFKVHLPDESESRPAQQEKRVENEERGQSGPGAVPVAVAVSSPPSQGPVVVPPVSTQGAATVHTTTTTSQGTSVGDTVTTIHSTLNPNAVEFKPRQQQPPQPAVMQQISSPAPSQSGTPPSQGPRQSPGMVSHPTLVQYNHTPFLQQAKMMPVASQAQPQTKQFPHPKRAVVSVDPAVLAHTATGQPLTLGAQGANMQQTSFVYVPTTNVLPQPYHQVPMRLMQSLPQGAGMVDPTLGATGQQPHVQQQFIMTQQPVPAHMPAAQALTQSMPQPAHTMHQHLPQHPLPPHQSNMPPASQSNVNPMPAASPVQHLGGNGHSHGHGPPQMNHTQGAPPTSNTPQSGMFGHGHQIPGILPPQGAASHAVPAHTVAQGPTPTLQFLHPGHQHQLPGAVSFTQAGATGASGPAPAHVQQSGHVNQTHHVVVMPHPPQQAINQGPINNPPHHHQQSQHATAAAQFQQQLQGASNQLHGPVGPNQHLLQQNVPAAGSGMGMHPTMHHHHYMPQGVGVQGSHHQGVNHTGGHSHPHFQGQ